MDKQSKILIATAIVLAVVYVAFFTGWFRPQTVGIFHTTRYVQRGGRSGKPVQRLMFGLSRRLRLTELKVVSLAATNASQDSLPLWHLVSSSNSVPVKSFAYGQRIRGLRPAVPGSRPQPLATNVPYRLIVEAGKIKGQEDFELK